MHIANLHTGNEWPKDPLRSFSTPEILSHRDCLLLKILYIYEFLVKFL